MPVDPSALPRAGYLRRPESGGEAHTGRSVGLGTLRDYSHPPCWHEQCGTRGRAGSPPLGQQQLFGLGLLTLKVDMVSGAVSVVTHHRLMAVMARRADGCGPCSAVTRSVARL